MSERREKQNERERVKEIILDRLSMGPTFRKDLHLECCRKLDKNIKPSLKPSRICEDMPDSRFDTPLKELFNSGTIRKERKGRYVFYSLVEEWKE
jgi:DNA-binding transcriptional ArsR family regulator